MNNDIETCYNHGKPYQLIGNDDRCELNCRICLQCLKGLDNSHKKGVSNHQTISLEQLNYQFHKIEKNNYENIVECNEVIDRYFKNLQNLLREEVLKQKNRLAKLVKRILLTNITKDENKLNIVQSLYAKQFSHLSCWQIGSVSSDLFNFIPKQNNIGFKKLIQEINFKQSNLYSQVQDIIQSKVWKKICLQKCQEDIKFPDFQEIKVSRIKTEQDSQKKTLRRSIRRQPIKFDLKEISIQIKKPLQLPGSKLVQNRQQSVFFGKMFDHKIIQNSYLLYRASEHNFSVKQFHKLCDGEPNTLVIAKTQFNKTIGGFTPIPWRSTANTLHSDIKCESFIFSLSLKQKMKLIDQKSAIFNSLNFGPTFGAGADLAICHNANTQKTSYSQFPYSYANIRYKENNQHSTTLFTGQKNGNHFLLKQWEVWKIHFIG